MPSAIFPIPQDGRPEIDNSWSYTRWTDAECQPLKFGFPEVYQNVPGGGWRGSNLATNFATTHANLRTAKRYAIARVAEVCNITFSEITPVGTNVMDAVVLDALDTNSSDSFNSADTSYPATGAGGGWSIYYPGHDWTTCQVGTYQFFCVMHEACHAFGLKHPHDNEGSFHLTMSTAYDWAGNTALSYRNALGDVAVSYNVAFGCAARSFGWLANRALQAYYGLPSLLPGDTIHSFGLDGMHKINGVDQYPTTPVTNVIAHTISGFTTGYNGYDFSNFVDTITDFRQPSTTNPSWGWSTCSADRIAVPIAGLPPYPGNIQQGATPGWLINKVTGGSGRNLGIFGGNHADYSFQKIGSDWIVVDRRPGSPDGMKTLTNLQFLQFADKTRTLNNSIHSGVVRVFGGASM